MCKVIFESSPSFVLRLGWGFDNYAKRLFIWVSVTSKVIESVKISHAPGSLLDSSVIGHFEPGAKMGIQNAIDHDLFSAPVNI